QDDGRRRAHADPGSRHARVQRNRSFHLPEDAEADVALRRAAIAALGAHAAIGPIAGVAAAAHGHAATADDPLPGVAGHVDQTPGIARTPAGGNQRAAAVAAASRRRHAVAVLGLLEAAAGAGGIEPFGIRRQAIAEAADIAEPPRISLRLAEHLPDARQNALNSLIDTSARDIAYGRPPPAPGTTTMKGPYDVPKLSRQNLPVPAIPALAHGSGPLGPLGTLATLPGCAGVGAPGRGIGTGRPGRAPCSAAGVGSTGVAGAGAGAGAAAALGLTRSSCSSSVLPVSWPRMRMSDS